MTHFLVYVRRSYRTAGDADVSDEAQVSAALAMLPPGATHEVIADSGGHQSGRTGERDGFRELCRLVRSGRAAGVVVYDVSRLARNARLVLEFRDAITAAGIPLLIATLPNTRWDTAAGGLVLTTLAAAAAFQADMDSERAKSIRRALFEDGYHRGHPPYGYRNGRDDSNRRVLEVDPDQADVVRRIFAEVATESLTDVAAGLARDGLPAPTAQGWTRYVVREVVLRAKVYLGLVVSGVEERPGRHAPIITPELHRAALAGLRARDGGGRKAGPGRAYLLTGLLACECGRRMVGHYGRGGGTYYWCRVCGRPMVRADAIEPVVLDAIRTYRVPASVMDAAREDLRRRLAGPADSTGTARRRLEGRLANLRKQHGWGDIDDATYRREVGETEAMLAGLPDEDKLLSFDRHRAAVVDLAEALEVLDAGERKRLVALFVEEVTTDGRIRWAAPFRPFFALASGAGIYGEPGRDQAPSTNPDPLEWWTA